MILLLGVIVFAVAIGYLFGGRLRRFALLRIRWYALAPIGLALQLVPVPDLRGDADRLIGAGLLIASYVLLLVLAAVNLRVSGFPLLLIGFALNFAVISVNGGMPVSREALEMSGRSASLQRLEEDGGAKHHLLGPADVLTPLADTIAIGGPIHEIVSKGDVVAYAGIGWVIVSVMRGWTRGLALEVGQEPYPGKHRRGNRRGSRRTARAEAPPPAARRSGTGP